MIKQVVDFLFPGWSQMYVYEGFVVWVLREDFPRRKFISARPNSYKQANVVGTT